MEKKYENPYIEVKSFDVDDIITTSGGGIDVGVDGGWDNDHQMGID